MTNKIVPENNFKVSNYVNNIKHTISDIGSDIEENYHDVIENLKLKEFVNKRTHDVEVANDKCKRWFNWLSVMYDHSIDNLPAGAMFGSLMTIVSFSYIWSGIDGVNINFYKYFTSEHVNTFIYYCIVSSSFVLLLHVAILLHGFSIFILETSRECCLVTNVGCYCCKNKNLKKCCMCFQSCAQTITQIVWGIVGTISCLAVYATTIILFNVSTISTMSSYILSNNCNYFKDLALKLKKQSLEYLELAKLSVHKADNTILMVLTQYNAWVDMKTKFLDSGVKTINTGIQQTTETYENNEFYFESPERFQYSNNYGRRLSETNVSGEFSILTELSKGQSILNILNNTIYETENQIQYYDTVFNQSIIVCKDYGDMFGSFYYITIGIGILLFSHLIMSAVHYKYFSVWMYEAKLVKLNK